MKPCGYQWGEGVGTDERAISKALRAERNFKEASVPVTDGGGDGDRGRVSLRTRGNWKDLGFYSK